MTDKRETIWVLEHRVNDYDQPWQIARWWKSKPSIEALASYLAMPLDKATSQQIVTVVEIWAAKSQFVRMDHVNTTHPWKGDDLKLVELAEGEGL